MVTEAESRLEAIQAAVRASFHVLQFGIQDGRPLFVITATHDDKERFLRLRQALEPLGVLPMLRRQGGQTVIMLATKPPTTQTQWGLPLALFGATLVTTFMAGYQNASPAVGTIPGLSPVAGGIAFSLSLMAILFCHEMGHKIISIWRRIDASLPFFIPMPPVPPFSIGTLGAVIMTRAAAPNRDALVELGASGPIAGFVAALPVLIYGVAHSAVVPHTAVLSNVCTIPTPRLMDMLTDWLLHPGAGQDVLIHPVAFAGWVGLLVTALNLLPGGMLDGGHVMRALFGPRAHTIISLAAVGIALLLHYWLMGLLILLLVRRGHPGPLDDVSPLTTARVVMAGALVVIFALSYVPLTLICR